MRTKLMAGIDLHSNNLFCGIVDLGGKRVFEKKLPCELPAVIEALKPFKKRLQTIAVESTYNWYWLVDGLQDNGYRTVLANPAAMQQYTGLKHADDKSDAFFLAEMTRLDILPTGHICDRELRPVRDLLRRRMGLVQKRTSVMLSLKSLYTRMTGRQMSLGQLKALEPGQAEGLFDHPRKWSLLATAPAATRDLVYRLDVDVRTHDIMYWHAGKNDYFAFLKRHPKKLLVYCFTNAISDFIFLKLRIRKFFYGIFSTLALAHVS